MGTSSDGTDTRAHPRYEVDASVDVSGGGGVLADSKIQNLSLGGICIQSAHVEEVGTVVDLVLRFTGPDDAIALRGEVVWVNRSPPADIGIRYLDVDDAQRDRLRRLIAQLA